MRLSATSCCTPSKATQFAALREYDVLGNRVRYDNDGYAIDSEGYRISFDTLGYPHRKRSYDVDYYDKDAKYKGVYSY